MSQLHAYRGLLRNGSLVRLLGGEFVSSIGDWLYMVALLVVIWNETRDPLLLGVVGVARIAPYAVLSVPAGMLADRFDRRQILIVTDVVRGLLMLVLAWLVANGANVGLVVGVGVLASCVATFFGPAISAYIPRIVGDESQLGPANSAWATLDNLAFMIGPGVAGLLIAAGGLQFAFLLNAVSFGICALVLVGLPHGRPGGSEEGAADGATDDAGSENDEPSEALVAERAAFRRLASLIRGPIALDSATGFVGGGLTVLTVVLAVDVLRSGEEATGYLNAATGVGGVVAGIMAGALTLRRLDLSLIGATLIGAVALVILGFTTDLAPALVAIGVAVGGLLILDVTTTTLVQRLAPDEIRGRAMGLLQTTGTVSYAAGSLLGPILASVIGVPGALSLMAGGLVALAALGVFLLSGTGALLPPAVDPARVRLLDAPVFAGLPPGRLEWILGQLAPEPVATGAVVIREGDAADRFFLIETGRYTVSQRDGDGSRLLREIGPGDVFGEIGLLSGGRRTATVTAIESGRLWALERDAFLEMVGSGPGLSTRLLDLYRGATP